MTAKSFLAKLNALAATPGKKDKLAIAQTFDLLDLRLAKAALDPTLSYYIAKLDHPVSVGTDEFDDVEWTLLAHLATRKITGNMALEAVAFSLAGLHPDDAEVLRRIILKDLRAGIGANTINTAFPGTIPDFPYQRCTLPKDSDIDKWDWTMGIYVQLKADGSFARVAHDRQGAVLITTRQGNTYPTKAMAKLTEDAAWCFKPGTETHGELTIWVNGELQPRTIGNGMLNSLQQGGDLLPGAEVRFDCWDQIPLEFAVPKGKVKTPYTLRHSSLKDQVVEAGRSSIMLIEGQIVYNKDEALAIYRSILARGLEGVILKHPLMEWKDGNSASSVKFKLEVDLDLEIVGFNPGTPGTRTEATFGSLKVQSADGLLEADVAGFKREMEQYLHENRDSVIGKILCVRANALAHPSESNDKHSLFHPRFVELRDMDKYEADTLESVKAQFDAAIA